MFPVSLEVPAKINLGLRIGDRRSDGYHELRTVFQTVDLRDRLTVERSSTSFDGLDVTGLSDGVPETRDNLVLRVLKGLRSRGVTIPPLDLSLEKRIPTGSGLGGGSSNAAGLLKVLGEWTPEQVTPELRAEVAAEVGSDAAFFLEGGTIEARGRGERLRDLEDLAGVALVAVPPYAVSSEWAYRALDERRSDGEAERDLVSPSGGRHWSEMDLTNDFDPVLAEEYPLHSELREVLENVARAVSVSGSGSALYGLFDDPVEARTVRDELANEYTGTNFYVAEFLGKDDIPVTERKASCRSK